MQDRVDVLIIKLKNGERRLNNLEVSIIEFIYSRSNKNEFSRDEACDLAANTFYVDNKLETMKSSFKDELKRLENN
jgi:hypothetical protein